MGVPEVDYGNLLRMASALENELDSMNEWELEFFENIYDRLKENKSLSDKQLDKFHAMWERLV